MAMKEWLQRLPPPRSMLALLLATAGFSGRLFASHVTNSPTLVVDTCHALCRLVGLITTLIAYKFSRADENAGREGKLRNTFGWARIEVVGRLSVHVLFASFAFALVVNALQLGVHSSHVQPPRYLCQFSRADENASREGKLRNTFGWARIEVVGRLSVHVLFASFAFALVVNALQLGVHSSHVQPPRFPRVIVATAVVGLLLHALNYMLLAGRELSYSRRLSMTESGGVVLKQGVGEPILAHAPTDIASSLFVMGAGLTAEWEGHAAGIVDPALSAIAAIVLVCFNYPFMRSAGMVLLQTVPEGLGACELKAAALRVPGVLAIHELHVWQLHRDRVVATAHVAYSSTEDYLKTSVLVCDVFKRHGISLVTLQPEFMLTHLNGTEEENNTLIQLTNDACPNPCAKDCIGPRCCEPPPKPKVARV